MSGDTHLLGPLFYGAEVTQIFSSQSQLQTMVKFEVALAHALEAAGVAPAGTGDSCENGAEGFPTTEQAQIIAQGAALSGNLAIPFVKLLTDWVRARAGDAADFIHFGATSQDLLDTALVLRLRDFLNLAESQLRATCDALVRYTRQHRSTLLPGRTWLQQGPPITFGLKTAQWLSSMLRHLDRLAAIRDRLLMLQFGGAVGTLASLGADGPAVTQELAQRLSLEVPDTPWHSQRDSLAELGAVLGLICGSVGKMARDLSLMLQHEVAEISLVAAEGEGGSSTMPHKRNPVALAVVLAASVRAPALAAIMISAMVQEHERGLGGWHAEWETLPELCCLTSGALASMLSALSQLRIDAEAMQHNLSLLQGVTLAEAVSMRLSRAIGRPAAHRVLEAASRAALERNIDLLIVLQEDPVVAANLSASDLAQALDPAYYLGSTELFIDQVLTQATRHLPAERLHAAR